MPASRLLVKRLRVTYVATRGRADLGEVGGPEAFEAKLVTPTQVAGMTVTLPYLSGPEWESTVERQFWRAVYEDSLPQPVTVDDKVTVREKGIPLRCRRPLETSAEKPRMELFLYPFGCIALATVDVTWSSEVPVETVLD